MFFSLRFFLSFRLRFFHFILTLYSYSCEFILLPFLPIPFLPHYSFPVIFIFLSYIYIYISPNFVYLPRLLSVVFSVLTVFIFNFIFISLLIFTRFYSPFCLSVSLFSSFYLSVLRQSGYQLLSVFVCYSRLYATSEYMLCTFFVLYICAVHKNICDFLPRYTLPVLYIYFLPGVSRRHAQKLMCLGMRIREMEGCFKHFMPIQIRY